MEIFNDRFSAVRDQTGMKIGTRKTEVLFNLSSDIQGSVRK